MKPGRLYLKIFLSFLIFLTVTEIAIFGFFILFFGREHRENFNRFNESKLILARNLIEDDLSRDSQLHPADNPAVKNLMNRMGTAFHGKIWLTRPDNSILYKSFEGNVPLQLIKKIKEHARRENRSHFRSGNREYYEIYGSQLIKLDGRVVANLHILFIEPPPAPRRIGFAAGLITIGIIIAVLIIPVSRQISRPIKNLTASAHVIENGDLSHRTKITTRDEIGELGTAFNSMAEKLEKMVISGKELTAQVSHELRSPLARIQLAVELIKDRLKQEENQGLSEHLLEIQEDVEELDQLIGRILELSKLDLKETLPVTEIFSPAALLETILKKYTPAFDNKRIKLTTDLGSEHCIKGNREVFNTAISNIIDNACKFSPIDGFLTISIKQKNESLQLIFENSFEMLETEELTKIFEPFYRISAIEKNRGGLGLAITKKIIEKHQGTISAVNTSKGLKIQIELPINI